MNKKKNHRTIVFYKYYFDDFFKEQKQKVKDKIIWTFDLIEELQRVPETYLKHIEKTQTAYLKSVFNKQVTSIVYFVSSTRGSWLS